MARSPRLHVCPSKGARALQLPLPLHGPLPPGSLGSPQKSFFTIGQNVFSFWRCRELNPRPLVQGWGRSAVEKALWEKWRSGSCREIGVCKTVASAARD